MKKFFRFAAVAVAAFAILSCEKNPDGPDTPGNTDEPTVEYTENIEFELAVKEVEYDLVKVQVSHNGTKTDSWYFFATTETDIAKAVEDKVDELTANLPISGLKKTKNTTATVRDLEPETDYNFVVFAITAEGDVYGQYKAIEFTTTAAPLEDFQVNPAWTVTYIGDYEEDGKVYEDVVSVESTDANTYFTTAWPKDLYEQHGIEAIAQAEIEGWLELLAKYGKTWDDVIMSGSTLSQVAIYTEEYGNEWYILAIGADNKGNLTGYYAVSELVTFQQEELTEGYAAWLGNWTITGANGNTQNVTFSIGKANKTFKMSGYEGDDAAGLDVIVEWMEEDGIWVIYNQKIGTYSFGQYGPGDIWFLGEGENEELYLSEVPICIGGTLEDGSLAAYGYEESFEGEDGTPMTYKVVTMEYLAYLTEYKELTYITGTFETGYPTFPMAFTPATKTTMHSTKEFKGGKKAFNPFAPKTFKAYDFNKSAKVRF